MCVLVGYIVTFMCVCTLCNPWHDVIAYSWAIGLAKVSRAYHNVNSVIQYLRLSSDVATGISINGLKSR
jgi:hypothetical protein